VLNPVKAGKGAYGYNSGMGEYDDVIDAGIPDLAKVTRLALQNAAGGVVISNAALLALSPRGTLSHHFADIYLSYFSALAVRSRCFSRYAQPATANTIN
jgi:hypothetical protein